MGVDLDGVRKEQQVVKAKLKQLTEEKEAIDKEIKTLEVELSAVSEKREKAYETLLELKKQRVEGVCLFTSHFELQGLAWPSLVLELPTVFFLVLYFLMNIYLVKFMSLSC